MLDGALNVALALVALAGLGLPWSAALGAVALKAVLAWLPALLLGRGADHSADAAESAPR